MRGGRESALQQRTTLPAIAALEAASVLTPQQAQGLREAYPFLRRVEHFLQYEKDAQTQILPANVQALAIAMGFTSADEFAAKLAATRDWVAQNFDRLSEKTPRIAPQVLVISSPNAP